MLWNFAAIQADVRSPNLKSQPIPADAQNDQEKYSAWWKEWSETEEGKAWRAASRADQRLRDASPFFSASVGRDGTFRIDDVPPGNYGLNVMFHESSPGQVRDYNFSVPAAEEADAGKPVDLGVITLMPTRGVSVSFHLASEVSCIVPAWCSCTNDHREKACGSGPRAISTSTKVDGWAWVCRHRRRQRRRRT